MTIWTDTVTSQSSDSAKKDAKTPQQSPSKKDDDDDFDIESYYARLHAIPSSFTFQDAVAKPIVEESTLSEIDLNSTAGNQYDDDERQQGLTSEIAQNLSQLPQVLPQVANTVLNSFSSILNLGRGAMKQESYDRKEYVVPSEPIVEIPDTVDENLPPVPLYNANELCLTSNLSNAGSYPLFDNVSPSTEPPKPSHDLPKSASNAFRLNTKKKIYVPVPGLTLGDYDGPVNPVQYRSDIGMPPMPPQANAVPEMPPILAQDNSSQISMFNPPMSETSVQPNANVIPHMFNQHIPTSSITQPIFSTREYSSPAKNIAETNPQPPDDQNDAVKPVFFNPTMLAKTESADMPSNNKFRLSGNRRLKYYAGPIDSTQPGPEHTVPANQPSGFPNTLNFSKLQSAVTSFFNPGGDSADNSQPSVPAFEMNHPTHASDNSKHPLSTVTGNATCDNVQIFTPNPTEQSNEDFNQSGTLNVNPPLNVIGSVPYENVSVFTPDYYSSQLSANAEPVGVFTPFPNSSESSKVPVNASNVEDERSADLPPISPPKSVPPLPTNYKRPNANSNPFRNEKNVQRVEKTANLPANIQIFTPNYSEQGYAANAPQAAPYNFFQPEPNIPASVNPEKSFGSVPAETTVPFVPNLSAQMFSGDISMLSSKTIIDPFKSVQAVEAAAENVPMFPPNPQICSKSEASIPTPENPECFAPNMGYGGIQMFSVNDTPSFHPFKGVQTVETAPENVLIPPKPPKISAENSEKYFPPNIGYGGVQMFSVNDIPPIDPFKGVQTIETAPENVPTLASKPATISDNAQNFSEATIPSAENSGQYFPPNISYGGVQMFSVNDIPSIDPFKGVQTVETTPENVLMPPKPPNISAENSEKDFPPNIGYGGVQMFSVNDIPSFDPFKGVQTVETAPENILMPPKPPNISAENSEKDFPPNIGYGGVQMFSIKDVPPIDPFKCVQIVPENDINAQMLSQSEASIPKAENPEYFPPNVSYGGVQMFSVNDIPSNTIVDPFTCPQIKPEHTDFSQPEINSSSNSSNLNFQTEENVQSSQFPVQQFSGDGNIPMFSNYVPSMIVDPFAASGVNFPEKTSSAPVLESTPNYYGQIEQNLPQQSLPNTEFFDNLTPGIIGDHLSSNATAEPSNEDLTPILADNQSCNDVNLPTIDQSNESGVFTSNFQSIQTLDPFLSVSVPQSDLFLQSNPHTSESSITNRNYFNPEIANNPSEPDLGRIIISGSTNTTNDVKLEDYLIEPSNDDEKLTRVIDEISAVCSDFYKEKIAPKSDSTDYKQFLLPDSEDPLLSLNRLRISPVESEPVPDPSVLSAFFKSEGVDVDYEPTWVRNKDEVSDDDSVRADNEIQEILSHIGRTQFTADEFSNLNPVPIPEVSNEELISDLEISTFIEGNMTELDEMFSKIHINRSSNFESESATQSASSDESKSEPAPTSDDKSDNAVPLCTFFSSMPSTASSFNF